MQKYGIENFTFTALKFIDNPTAEILTFWENYFMVEENGNNVFNLGPAGFSSAGIKRSAETKALMAANSPHNQAVKIFDTLNSSSTTYISITEAANAIGVYRKMVSRYAASGKLILRSIQSHIS